MKLVRRYWGAGLIVLMVAVHAAVIGYVRSRVARLSSQESSAVEIGRFRFQPVGDTSSVIQFRMHALVDPSKLYRGKEQLKRMQMEICEKSEQKLRMIDVQLLDDPEHVQIREKLMEVVRQHLDEPLVQRVLITDWLRLPVQVVAGDVATSPALAVN